MAIDQANARDRKRTGWNTADLPAGVYWLEVEGEPGRVEMQLIHAE